MGWFVRERDRIDCTLNVLKNVEFDDRCEIVLQLIIEFVLQLRTLQIVSTVHHS